MLVDHLLKIKKVFKEIKEIFKETGHTDYIYRNELLASMVYNFFIKSPLYLQINLLKVVVLIMKLNKMSN